MIFHQDNLSAGFFLGVGCLALTRGLGPCTGVAAPPPATAIAKEGGPGPVSRATVPQRPVVIGATLPGRGVRRYKKQEG